MTSDGEFGVPKRMGKMEGVGPLDLLVSEGETDGSF